MVYAIRAGILGDFDVIDGDQVSGEFEQVEPVLVSQPESLVNGTHVRLVHRPGTDVPALVIFGDENNGPKGQAARTMSLDEREEADLYEIFPEGKNWYPISETGPLTEVLDHTRGGKPALAIGASMGGYGALRYAKRAGCSAVLSFGPQARLEPGMTGVGAKYAGFYRADLHHDMEITSGHLPERAYVVIDPANAHDLLHAELLRHEAGADVIALRHMGHRTDKAMSSPETIDAALAAAASGDREGLARALRRGRRNVPSFLARLSLACSQKGHPRWAADIARLPERDGQELSPELRLSLAVARAGLGLPFEALEDIESLIVAAPQNARFWRALVEQYETMEQHEAAGEVLELALGETENFMFCWKLIENRMQAGRTMEARMLSDLALEQWPDHAPQIERMRTRLDEVA